MRTSTSVAVGIALAAVSARAWAPPARSSARGGARLAAVSRRELLADAAFVLGVAAAAVGPAPARADDAAAAAPAAASGLATFNDPVKLFRVDLPKGWYKVRPTADGDLPDSDGNGRRGPRIFSAGDVSNPYAPQILSVERFPMTALFQDVGMGKGKAGAVSWQDVGKAELLADVLVNRRDAETTKLGKSMTTSVVKGSVVLDGNTLTFQAVTDVPVMRADLLEEQTGRREIKRLSLYRGELRAGQVMGASDKVEARSIVTALWLSLEASDYGEAATKARFDAIQNSFTVF